jgi:hypothetical protein
MYFAGNKPEWVIVGIQMKPPNGTGVMLLASTEMNYAELETVYYRDHEMDHLGRIHRSEPTIRSIQMNTSVRSFVMVEGDDYPDALLKLFGEWNPNGPERPGLIQGAPELERGDG